MADSGFETIALSEAAPRVLLLALNRPERANAINTKMAEELLAVFQDLASHGPETRCLLLTGTGKTFCAGGDLKERAQLSESAWREQHRIMEHTILAMLDVRMPIVAAVNGAAFAGGLELALSADFIYASETASFALTETRLGIMPGAGGTQNLPRAAGLRRAKELIFSAVSFNAAEALAWGIVNRITPQDALMSESLAVAARIAANAPLAVRQAKKAIDGGFTLDVRSGLRFAFECYHHLLPSRDRSEGINAFLEKREPRFTGG